MSSLRSSFLKNSNNSVTITAERTNSTKLDNMKLSNIKLIDKCPKICEVQLSEESIKIVNNKPKESFNSSSIKSSCNNSFQNNIFPNKKTIAKKPPKAKDKPKTNLSKGVFMSNIAIVAKNKARQEDSKFKKNIIDVLIEEMKDQEKNNSSSRIKSCHKTKKESRNNSSSKMSKTNSSSTLKKDNHSYASLYNKKK